MDTLPIGGMVGPKVYKPEKDQKSVKSNLKKCLYKWWFTKKIHCSVLFLRYFIYFLWRGQDLNLRPSGYEPDELPYCS